MSRLVIAVDRAIALVVGLLLVALGAATVVWWNGSIAGWPLQLGAGPVIRASTQPWWPWAAGAVGVVLVLVGLRWAAGHVPRRRVSHVKLPGSSAQGRLTAQVGPVGGLAADVFGQTPGVRSARGSIRHDRGQVLATIDATIEPGADLGQVAAAADRVSADLRRVLERDDMRAQVRLRVARRERALPRVR